MRSPALACLLMLHTAALPAAEDVGVMLKALVKNVRNGKQDALAPLKDVPPGKLAAETVLGLVNDRRVGYGMKLRLAEIVADWPTGEGRQLLADWLAKHPTCDDETLMFFSGIRLLEARGFFWGLLTQAKEPLSALKNPSRVAMAVRALGAFHDNPEFVVARVASLLDAANPHVIRACAAEALGGMRSPTGLRALPPLLNDDAIGETVRASLFQLTGQDFVQDVTKWDAWLKEHSANIPWKMLPRSDYAEYLKVQKLFKPLDDDPAMQMATFYGLDVRGKGALFILDVSGSMSRDDRISKLHAQMSNLIAALQTKSRKVRYGIITFGAEVDSCFPGRGMAVNDEKNHKQAVQFVENLQAGGGTPMCEALNHALTRILPDGGIDAIYFLSDGQPTDGTPAQVLDLAQRIHTQFKVRIHTISIGEEPGQNPNELSLLHQMADACEGTFVLPP